MQLESRSVSKERFLATKSSENENARNKNTSAIWCFGTHPLSSKQDQRYNHKVDLCN